MITQLKFSRTPQVQNYAQNICEPPRPILEPQFFDNLIQVFEQLTIELGFTYYNGKVAIIEVEEENSDE